MLRVDHLSCLNRRHIQCFPYQLNIPLAEFIKIAMEAGSKYRMCLNLPGASIGSALFEIIYQLRQYFLISLVFAHRVDQIEIFRLFPILPNASVSQPASTSSMHLGSVIAVCFLFSILVSDLIVVWSKNFSACRCRGLAIPNRNQIR